MNTVRMESLGETTLGISNKLVTWSFQNMAVIYDTVRSQHSRWAVPAINDTFLPDVPKLLFPAINATLHKLICQ